MAPVTSLAGETVALPTDRHYRLELRAAVARVLRELGRWVPLTGRGRARWLGREYNAEHPGDGVPLVLLGKFRPLVELLLKVAVADRLQNVGVARLVDGEGFPAVQCSCPSPKFMGLGSREADRGSDLTPGVDKGCCLSKVCVCTGFGRA